MSPQKILFYVNLRKIIKTVFIEIFFKTQHNNLDLNQHKMNEQMNKIKKNYLAKVELKVEKIQ
jgi:hypothetical protein